MAQVDSLVKVNAKATPLNDSMYTLQYHVQVKEGWRVYGNTPPVEPLGDPITNGPLPGIKLETVQFIGKNGIQYSATGTKQKDAIFQSAIVLPNIVDASIDIIIKGFQPDSLKTYLTVQISKGDEFYEKEIPVSIFLANGKKAAGVQILLSTTATTPPDGACGEAVHDSKESSGWTVFVLGFLGGLIALITPCVFPMIPLTVSFFTK